MYCGVYLEKQIGRMQDNDDNLLTDINLNSDKFYSYVTDVLIFSIIEVIAEKLNLV